MIIQGNTNDGFVKAEQLYYFDSSTTDFTVIGSVTDEFFELLIDFMKSLDIELEHIIDNLK